MTFGQRYYKLNQPCKLNIVAKLMNRWGCSFRACRHEKHDVYCTPLKVAVVDCLVAI